MKKFLLFGGIAVAGFGLYRYFKYQIDLALNYDYKLKDFKILSQEGDIVKVSSAFEIINKSSFKIEIESYDLLISFKDLPFAVTKSDEKIIVQPESSFEIENFGEIDFANSKKLIIPFLKDVLNKEPIDVSITGTLKIKFLGIRTTLSFDKQKFNYSTDLIEELKLSGAYERLKVKYPKVFALIGIK